MQSRLIRRETSSAARLISKDGSVLSATIRNFSAGGAKIQVETEGDIAAEFRIECSELEISEEAVVVWRLGSLVGVRLMADAPAVAPPGERRKLAVYRSHGAGGPAARPTGAGG